MPALSRTRSLLLFLVIVLPLCLWRLGSPDIVMMEGIVADGARSMEQGTSLLVPRLHGAIYAYKPPLAYWLAMLSFRVFDPQSEWALRLPFTLCGLGLGLVVLGGIGRRLGYATGLVAALASTSGVLTVQKLRLAEFDMPLAAGVGAAATLAAVDLASPTASARRWLGAYACLSFGFLAKGVPALMFFIPGLVAAALFVRRPGRLLSPEHLAGALLFTLLIGSWLLGAWITEGWSAFAQPVAEAADKGLGWSLDALALTLFKPGVAWALFFPWSLALLALARRSAWDRLDPKAREVAAAAAGFLVGGLLAFMAVPATESRYLLPISAPLGVLAAVLLCGMVSPLPRWLAAALTFATGLGVAVGSSAALLGWQDLALDPAAGALLLAGAALTVALGVLFVRRPAWPLHTALSVTAVCLAGFHILATEPHRAGVRSLRTIAAAFHRHLPDDVILWSGPVSKHFRHSSLTYYLDRPVRTFSSRPPPDGSYTVLFSDEEPGLEPPFGFEPLEARTSRSVRFDLVRVTAGRDASRSTAAAEARRSARDPLAEP